MDLLLLLHNSWMRVHSADSFFVHIKHEFIVDYAISFSELNQIPPELFRHIDPDPPQYLCNNLFRHIKLYFLLFRQSSEHIEQMLSVFGNGSNNFVILFCIFPSTSIQKSGKFGRRRGNSGASTQLLCEGKWLCCLHGFDGGGRDQGLT